MADKTKIEVNMRIICGCPDCQLTKNRIVACGIIAGVLFVVYAVRFSGGETQNYGKTMGGADC